MLSADAECAKRRVSIASPPPNKCHTRVIIPRAHDVNCGRRHIELSCTGTQQMSEPSHEERGSLENAAAAELARHISPLFNDVDDYDSDDDTSFEADLFTSDAQKHWDESVKQLDQALFFILCPVIGRILGRRFAKSLWVRFVDWRWHLCQHRGIFASEKAHT